MDRSNATPELSVVVPSVNGLGDLVGCLEALEAERSGARLQVIVADRLGDAVRREVARRFPAVHLLAAPLDTTIPVLRALAIRAATGEIVAIIEDHVIVPRGWARQILDAAAAGADVVGGSVENAATTTLMDWAAFLCEYSAALPPLPEGEVTWLVGNNVGYRRSVLVKYLDILDAGRWENHLHDAMRRDGIPLICRPSITVGHKKHYTFSEYASQRFLYARSYAGMRVSGAPLPKRLAYGAAALALPPLLFYRTVSRVLSKGRHLGLLIRSVPLLALFVTAWGAGEAVGYIHGPGDSLSKVC